MTTEEVIAITVAALGGTGAGAGGVWRWLGRSQTAAQREKRDFLAFLQESLEQAKGEHEAALAQRNDEHAAELATIERHHQEIVDAIEAQAADCKRRLEELEAWKRGVDERTPTHRVSTVDALTIGNRKP